MGGARRALLLAAVAAAAAAVDESAAFSLPGVQMTTYKKGERMPLFVNSLTSAETLLPLDYYKLPFCQVREAVGTTRDVLLWLWC